MRIEAKQKLIEKHIKWEEKYTDKTQYLKDQFDDVVGPGSYFRFEGKSSDGSEYYCILGPAKIHDPKAKFFAGVRKLPATYPAGGKYFDSLDRAAKYAEETWGIHTPKSLRPYTSRQLFGISERVKKWKNERGESDNDEKDGADKTAFSIDYIVKQAMGAEHKEQRANYIWNTYEAITTPGACPAFEAIAKENPAFYLALNEIRDEKRMRYALYTKKYGLSPEDIRRIFTIYIGYSKDHGLYMLCVGSYLMSMSDMDEFYKKATEEGFYNGVPGGDVDNATLVEICRRGSTRLKRKAALFFADKKGYFSSWMKPFPLLPKDELKVSDQLDKFNKKISLTSFDKYGMPSEEEHMQSMAERGVPLPQSFTADDYSYVFGYNTAIKRHSKQIISQKLVGPDGKTASFNIFLPDNLRGNSNLSIYSLNNYEEARKNHVILSKRRTRILLNRSGQRKVLLNLFARNPELSQLVYKDLIESKASSLSGYLGKNGFEVVSQSFSNFLYCLTGFGNMSEADINKVKYSQQSAHLTKLNQLGKRNLAYDDNGVINADHIEYSDANEGMKRSCGNNIMTQLCGLIGRSFQIFGLQDLHSKERPEIIIELNKIRQIKKEIIKLSNAKKKESRLMNVQEINKLNRRIDEIIANGSPELQMAFQAEQSLEEISHLSNLGIRSNSCFPPDIASINSPLSISSAYKNKIILMKEISDLMLENNINQNTESSRETIAKLLNENPLRQQILKEKKKRLFNTQKEISYDVVFTGLNIWPFMNEIDSIRMSGNGMMTLQELNQFLSKKETVAVGLSRAYHSSVQENEFVAEDDAGSETIQPMNLTFNEETGQFEMEDVFHSMNEAILSAGILTDNMALPGEEAPERKSDPVSKVVLRDVNPQNGEIDLNKIQLIMRTPRPNDMHVDELSEIYDKADKQSMAEYRSSLRGTAFSLVTDVFGVDAMTELNRHEYTLLVDETGITGENAEQDAKQDIEEEAEEEAEEDVVGDIDDITDEEGNEEGDEDDFDFDFDIDVEPEAGVAKPVVNEATPQPPKSPKKPNSKFKIDNGLDDLDEPDNQGEKEGQDTLASSSAVKGLLKLSEELDNAGKNTESIELLKIAKKIANKIKKG